MKEHLNKTAADLGRGIGAGEIDPVALTEAFLGEIDTHWASDRVFARVTVDRAMAEASAARDRAKAGRRRSLLDGVPISWKDLYDTAGVATESGSALLAGRVPERDAVVLASATAAGLVCLGKTHQTELAFSGLGYNPVTATPPNAIKSELSPGGSSSGAATSVKFGLSSAGIGSDTGGSVRIPSAWNDLVGFKPSHGVLPLTGVVPLAAKFDTVGPLCRSVEDAALLFSAMGGGAAVDLTGAQLNGARLLVLETGVAGAEDTPLVGFQAAVKRLQSAGAEVVHGDLREAAAALEMAGPIYTTEAYATWGEAIEAAPEKVFEGVRERFRAGRNVSGVEYEAAWQKLHALRATYRAASARYDAVIYPTSPIMPPKIADLEADLDYFTERNVTALRNTRIGNLLGLTALTVPTGTPMTGLMLSMAPGSDRRLLRLGRAVEAALS